MTLRPLTPNASPACAPSGLAWTNNAAGSVGVVYRERDGGPHRLLHQAWHYDTRNDEVAVYATAYAKPMWWVDPGLDPLELADLGTHARNTAQRVEKGGLPYALAVMDAWNKDGAIDLRASLGLTCATFVLLLFESAGVSLIDATTWNQGSQVRVSEDTLAQRWIVDHLGEHEHQDAESHAQKVRADIGCTRIRAEEVAAASALAPRPVGFAEAEPAGRVLLGEMV